MWSSHASTSSPCRGEHPARNVPIHSLWVTGVSNRCGVRHQDTESDVSLTSEPEGSVTNSLPGSLPFLSLSAAGSECSGPGEGDTILTTHLLDDFGDPCDSNNLCSSDDSVRPGSRVKTLPDLRVILRPTQQLENQVLGPLCLQSQCFSRCRVAKETLTSWLSLVGQFRQVSSPLLVSYLPEASRSSVWLA